MHCAGLKRKKLLAVLIDKRKKIISVEWIAVLVASLSVARMLILSPSTSQFDLDPVVFSVQGINGPAFRLFLDFFIILLSVLGFFLHSSLCKSINPWLLMPVFLLPSVFWHGANTIESMDRVVSIFSVLVGSLFLGQMAINIKMRALLLLILFSAGGPLLVKIFAQAFLENPSLREVWLTDSASILGAAGISPESSSAKVFEDRLLDPSASAWFSSSNIAGALMASIALVWISVFYSFLILKEKTSKINYVFGLFLSFAFVFSIFLTGSKSALICLLFGVLLLSAREFKKTIFRPLAFSLLCLTLFAVPFRAIFGLDGLSEISLWVRWGYASTAIKIFFEYPFLGSGPDDFVKSFILLRGEGVPESVFSAHSWLFDYPAMFGVAGFLPVIYLLHRCCWIYLDEPKSFVDLSRYRGPVVLLALCVFLVQLLSGDILESSQSVFIHSIGWFILFPMATLLVRAMDQWASVLLKAAPIISLVLLFHGLVDFGFIDSGSSPWMWSVVAVSIPPKLFLLSSVRRKVVIFLLFTPFLWWHFNGKAFKSYKLDLKMLDSASYVNVMQENLGVTDGELIDSVREDIINEFFNFTALLEPIDSNRLWEAIMGQVSALSVSRQEKYRKRILLEAPPSLYKWSFLSEFPTYEYLERHAELNPWSPHVAIEFADYLWDSEAYEESRQWYRSAIRLNKGWRSVEAKRGLSEQELIRALHRAP